MSIATVCWHTFDGGGSRNDEHACNVQHHNHAMQKNVRRRKSCKAARVAHALLTVSPADLLRRCLVICLEDSLLHPQLPALVWLMCAQPRGYLLTVDHRALVIDVVAQIAGSPVCDVLPPDPSKSDDQSSPPGPFLCRSVHVIQSVRECCIHV